MPIILLAPNRAFPRFAGGESAARERLIMTTYDEIRTGSHYRLSRKMRILLFFLVEGVAALAVGFAVLFLSFEPGWSAEARKPPCSGRATPAPARCC